MKAINNNRFFIPSDTVIVPGSIKRDANGELSICLTPYGEILTEKGFTICFPELHSDGYMCECIRESKLQKD